MYIPLSPPPQADTPGQTPPPPPELATAADGTHPTGMHSSCTKYCSCYEYGNLGQFQGVKYLNVVDIPMSVVENRILQEFMIQ